MKKIAIIGAGPGGLAAAVSALEEGLQPHVFEASQRIGGVWGPDNRELSDHGTAWPGMKVNVSRHTGTFSNFPWPETTPDFPTTQEVYDYLLSYATHFGILPHIRFGSRVINITQPDGKWLVQWQETQGVMKEEVFDALIIATSRFSKPYTPPFKGLEKIKVNHIHSSKYKSPNEFTDKKTLLVGGSLSSVSLAEDLIKKTEVIHLIRKPRWIVKRFRSSDPQNNGALLPRDLSKTFISSQKKLTADEQYQFMLQHCAEQNEYPEWRMLPSSPLGFAVADEYFDGVRKQKIKPVQGEVDHFLEESVVLTDGRTIEFDAVIFCTGYQRDLPFLPPALRLESAITLYEDIFHCDAANIAYIGMYPNARGAAFPVLELQTRYACGVISERLKLPASDKLHEAIANTPKERDEIQYMTALAEKLGVMPDMNSTNLNLRHLLLYGAFTPERFRQTGVHNNADAALKAMEEKEAYRLKLLNAKSTVPSLAYLCFFKHQESKKIIVDNNKLEGLQI